MESGKRYKVKLGSGRILGPLDIDRVRLLVLKNQITGVETARHHPDGDWKNINQIPEIAELLLAKIEGRLDSIGIASHIGDQIPLGGEAVHNLASATVMLPEEPEPDPPAPAPPPPPDPTIPASKEDLRSAFEVPEHSVRLDLGSDFENEKTKLSRVDDAPGGKSYDDGEKTQMVTMRDIPPPVTREPTLAPLPEASVQFEMAAPNPIADAKTVFFQRSPTSKGEAKSKKAGAEPPSRQFIIRMLLLAALGYFGMDVIFPPEETVQKTLRPAPIRPKLPSYSEEAGSPDLSKRSYNAGIKPYLNDTVEGYKKASELFLKAAGQDITNVQALAMLASSYLNLIDSSNKDEKYFSVISKLIEMSRAKNVDLPETVIADVEFFTTVNSPEAAQNRIVEYTKTHPNFGPEMFYYLAYAFYSRGDNQSAARYVSQIPDAKAFSPKVFYLRGQIYQTLGSLPEAMAEYGKAVGMSPSHARSRLAIAKILDRAGKLREASGHLDYILTHPGLLPAQPLAEAYYLRGRLNEVNNQQPQAMADIEKAVKLDPDNHDYILELYTLQAKAGDTDPKFREKARMYYFLSDGEQKLKTGRDEEALASFLQAREADIKSPLPLEKIGDMFLRLNNMVNALMNYRKAAELAPEEVHVWSKYIQTLIQSYELDEAAAAMKKFKKVPGAKSSMDKLSGDLYAKQGMHVEAQVFYKKAMARDTIDPDVYVAYADSLQVTGNCKDAPFYYALGLRIDPLSMEAVIGTAKCIAQTDSIQRAVVMLQDELQKLGGARAELISAIAELRIQGGDWELAQDSVDAAIGVNNRYAKPFLLQAQIYRNKEGLDKNALTKALDAYKSYLERNPSDPQGYLERYKIFLKTGQFDKAQDELAEIFKLYPKYPGIHYFKGSLYSVMGNSKLAIAEYEAETQIHPNSVEALVALGKEMVKVSGDKDTVSQALSLFTKAMALNPGYGEAKQQAGWANFLIKNYVGASALLQAAATADPGNPVIYKRQGIVYQAMGDGANAAAAFKKYLELAPDAPDRAEFERFAQ